MRLALFAMVNIIVGGGFGLLAYVQGFGMAGIVFTVLGVLIALQLTYVLWIVVISFMKPADAASAPKHDGLIRSGGARLNTSSRTSDPAN